MERKIQVFDNVPNRYGIHCMACSLYKNLTIAVTCEYMCTSEHQMCTVGVGWGECSGLISKQKNLPVKQVHLGPHNNGSWIDNNKRTAKITRININILLGASKLVREAQYNEKFSLS